MATSSLRGENYNFEMKNILDGIKIKLDILEEIISELENVVIETMKIKAEKKD